jgi:hypothetical protein
MKSFWRGLALTVLSVACASVVYGIVGTIWYQNGISERTLPASGYAFLFFMTFSTPPAIVFGFPISRKAAPISWPLIGAVLGTAYGFFLTWLDDFFTGPGVSLSWSLVGTLDGVLIGVFGFLFLYVDRRSR